MQTSDVTSLQDSLNKTSHRESGFLAGRATSIALADLTRGSCLCDPLSSFSGHSVLIATCDQLATALALIELDGVVRRLTLCPPDLPYEHLPSVVANAGIDKIVCDRDSTEYGSLGVPVHFICTTAISPMADFQLSRCPTEWVLLTSGTTGLPKMVAHSLGSLTAAISATKIGGKPAVWGTFYDVRRYGGLQVLFRAILGGGSFVLSSSEESLSQYLDRLGAHHATHVLGTPSHRSPITGSIVVADVVLKVEPDSSSASVSTTELKEEILQVCRDALAQHKVPGAIRFVGDLDVGATGKLARHA